MRYCMFEPTQGYYPSSCDNNCDTCGYSYYEPFGDIIKEWRIEAKVETPVLYKYDSFKKVLTICTSRPGYMIGYHGKLINKYKAKLINEHMHIDTIEFLEVANELC